MINLNSELVVLQKYINSYCLIDTIFKNNKVINNSGSINFIFKRNSKVLINSKSFVDTFIKKNVVKYLDFDD